MVLRARKYKMMMDGSHHITTRKRRLLRKIPGPENQLEQKDDEEGEEEREQDSPLVPDSPVQIPVQDPEPVQDRVEVPDAPRQTSRTRNNPDRLEVTATGKTYTNTVKAGLGEPWEKGDVSQR